MLVLSRKKDQRILFPSLGITLDILRVSGNTVSVGIQAPRSIQVLRGELAPTQSANSKGANSADASDAHNAPLLTHEIRNQLNHVFLSIALVQKLLSQGLISDAEQSLNKAVEGLLRLDRGIEITSEEEDANQTNPPSADVASANSNRPNESTQLKRRTLLVEDDPNERALLAGYLRMSGYEVLTAKDGIEALELLAREPVDLVVLDMRMPRMNGEETLSCIRKDPFLKDLQVVVVSGEDPRTISPPQLQAGIDEWFSKPLDPSKLVEHLEASRN